MIIWLASIVFSIVICAGLVFLINDEKNTVRNLELMKECGRLLETEIQLKDNVCKLVHDIASLRLRDYSKERVKRKKKPWYQRFKWQAKSQ
jgi:hypothetical protein